MTKAPVFTGAFFFSEQAILKPLPFTWTSAKAARLKVTNGENENGRTK
jgi:hypothetical protein